MRRAGRRALAIAGVVVLVLAVLVVGASLALEPLAERELHRMLDGSRGVRGTLHGLEISVLDLSAKVRDLKLEVEGPDGRFRPLLDLAEGELGLYRRELLNGHVVAAATLRHPKLYVLVGVTTREEQVRKPIDLARTLQRAMPFRLDRAEVHDGEILFVEPRVEGRPRLWVHALEATLDNVASREALARGEPSVLAASGTVQRSGALSLYASADPLAKSLTFAGQARLSGLKLVELGELIAGTTGVSPTKGTLDVSVRFQAVNGQLTGGIRPVLNNPDVQQGKPGLGEKLKALLADAALDLLSDRVPGRNAVATTIPIRGDVSSPDAMVWPTVLGVIRNSFITGLTDSLANLPPTGKAQASAPDGEEGGDRERAAQGRRGR